MSDADFEALITGLTFERLWTIPPKEGVVGRVNVVNYDREKRAAIQESLRNAWANLPQEGNQRNLFLNGIANLPSADTERLSLTNIDATTAPNVIAMNGFLNDAFRTPEARNNFLRIVQRNPHIGAYAMQAYNRLDPNDQQNHVAFRESMTNIGRTLANSDSPIFEEGILQTVASSGVEAWSQTLSALPSQESIDQANELGLPVSPLILDMLDQGLYVAANETDHESKDGTGIEAIMAQGLEHFSTYADRTTRENGEQISERSRAILGAAALKAFVNQQKRTQGASLQMAGFYQAEAQRLQEQLEAIQDRQGAASGHGVHAIDGASLQMMRVLTQRVARNTALSQMFMRQVTRIVTAAAAMETQITSILSPYQQLPDFEDSRFPMNMEDHLPGDMEPGQLADIEAIADGGVDGIEYSLLVGQEADWELNGFDAAVRPPAAAPPAVESGDAIFQNTEIREVFDGVTDETRLFEGIDHMGVNPAEIDPPPGRFAGLRNAFNSFYENIRTLGRSPTAYAPLAGEETQVVISEGVNSSVQTGARNTVQFAEFLTAESAELAEQMAAAAAAEGGAEAAGLALSTRLVNLGAAAFRGIFGGAAGATLAFTALAIGYDLMATATADIRMEDEDTGFQLSAGAITATMHDMTSLINVPMQAMITGFSEMFTNGGSMDGFAEFATSEFWGNWGESIVEQGKVMLYKWPSRAFNTFSGAVEGINNLFHTNEQRDRMNAMFADFNRYNGPNELLNFSPTFRNDYNLFPKHVFRRGYIHYNEINEMLTRAIDEMGIPFLTVMLRAGIQPRQQINHAHEITGGDAIEWQNTVGEASVVLFDIRTPEQLFAIVESYHEVLITPNAQDLFGDELVPPQGELPPGYNPGDPALPERPDETSPDVENPFDDPPDEEDPDEETPDGEDPDGETPPPPYIPGNTPVAPPVPYDYSQFALPTPAFTAAGTYQSPHSLGKSGLVANFPWYAIYSEWMPPEPLRIEHRFRKKRRFM